MLFLLDEAGHLGKMQILETAVTTAVRHLVVFLLPSANQVAQCLGDRATRFLDNIGLQLYFGTNAFEAEAISERCGDTTVVIESLNRNKSGS